MDEDYEDSLFGDFEEQSSENQYLELVVPDPQVSTPVSVDGVGPGTPTSSRGWDAIDLDEETLELLLEQELESSTETSSINIPASLEVYGASQAGGAPIKLADEVFLVPDAGTPDDEATILIRHRTSRAKTLSQVRVPRRVDLPGADLGAVAAVISIKKAVGEAVKLWQALGLTLDEAERCFSEADRHKVLPADHTPGSKNSAAAVARRRLFELKAALRFLGEAGIGEKYFGANKGAANAPKKQFLWPQDSTVLAIRIIPLLRKIEHAHITRQGQKRKQADTSNPDEPRPSPPIREQRPAAEAAPMAPPELLLLPPHGRCVQESIFAKFCGDVSEYAEMREMTLEHLFEEFDEGASHVDEAFVPTGLPECARSRARNASLPSPASSSFNVVDLTSTSDESPSPTTAAFNRMPVRYTFMVGPVRAGRPFLTANPSQMGPVWVDSVSRDFLASHAGWKKTLFLLTPRGLEKITDDMTADTKLSHWEAAMVRIRGSAHFDAAGVVDALVVLHRDFNDDADGAAALRKARDKIPGKITPHAAFMQAPKSVLVEIIMQERQRHAEAGAGNAMRRER